MAAVPKLSVYFLAAIWTDLSSDDDASAEDGKRLCSTATHYIFYVFNHMFIPSLVLLGLVFLYLSCPMNALRRPRAEISPCAMTSLLPVASKARHAEFLSSRPAFLHIDIILPLSTRLNLQSFLGTTLFERLTFNRLAAGSNDEHEITRSEQGRLRDQLHNHTPEEG